MNERRNNLGRQFTGQPHFGNVYPNTQYKGYADGEAEPFGGPSDPRLNQSISSQSGNVRYHGGNTTNQPTGRSQYQPVYQGNNQYQNTGNTYQGLNQYQISTPTNLPQQQTNPQYNDQDRVTDLLTSEKHLTELYNVSALEASNPQLQNTLIGLLNETHNNCINLHRTIEQRGWYKAEPADQQMVSQVHNQFSNYKNQLPF